jgi:phosphohistidine phosphatase SixA
VDIYLLRPGLPEDEAAPDAHRYLSLTGRQKLRAVGTKLRQLEPNLELDRIVVAPTALAMQTAELFAERLDFLGAPEVLAQLVAGVPAQVVAPSILARGEHVVVVADEPCLSELGAFLAGRPTFPTTVRAQVSLLRDRRPEWVFRPDTHGPTPLLLA